MKFDNGNRWASSMRTFHNSDNLSYQLQTNNFDILMDIAVETYNIELYNMLSPRYDTNKRSANSNRVTPFVVCEYDIKKSILYKMTLSEQMNDDALAFLTMLIEKYSVGNLFTVSKKIDNKILYRYLKKIMGATKYTEGELIYRGVSLDISHYDKPIRSFKTHRPMNWNNIFAQGCQLDDTQMMLIAAKNGAKKCK